MAVLLIGLTPISPTIEVVPVVEIPDFARIAKLPDDPRFTAAGPAALATGDRKRTNKIKPNRFLYSLSISANLRPKPNTRYYKCNMAYI